MSEAKRALITGVTGQDGSYMAEQLLEKGYEVHGLVRRSSTFNREPDRPPPPRRAHPGPHLHLHYGDVTDAARMAQLSHDIRPHEVYNLAAQSHVRVSFDEPVYTAQATGVDAEPAGGDPQPDTSIRFYQASHERDVRREPAAAERGHAVLPAQPLRRGEGLRLLDHQELPRGLRHVRRQRHLFNHESPRRGETFVTRKITRAVAHPRDADRLYMGNLDSIRDWGYAPEYVEGMWRMLQADEPEDFVLATGTAYTIRDFLPSPSTTPA